MESLGSYRVDEVSHNRSSLMLPVEKWRDVQRGP
ncbi:hypothetical protein AK34_1771 [Burkholderia dolosa AU0158]|jgi:hypothetical protein|nr:hypothetical protein AK34_1771 [Burkholderia dolosa AU0158]VWC08066.1 hypothetical protein BDO18943_05170 [Burkholderia dolosa]